MMHRLREISMAIVAAGALELAACTSSTEPTLRNSADGLTVHLDVTPRSPKVGDVITATLTILNSSSATLSRTYPPHDFGPYVRSSSSTQVLVQSLGDGFGDFVDEGQSNRFDFAPQQPVTITAHFDALGAGSAELRGCLPGGDAAGSETICEEMFVAVSAK
jgi:hypothetical protein